MASKLEYLQRYVSAAPDAGDKKLRKKKKKAAAAPQSRFQVIDADHEWTQDAPSKDDIESKWEMDAADEERPVVVADGEVVDPSDLPVYVNAEEYLDELHEKKRAAADQEDLSPPRKVKSPLGRSSPPRATAGAERGRSNNKNPRRKYSSDGSSPPRKTAVVGIAGRGGRERNDDASPPRQRAAPSKRKAGSDSEDDDVSPPRRGRPSAARPNRRRGGEDDNKSDDDASPPRRRSQQARKKSASSSPVRRRPAATKNGNDSNASPVRRTVDRKSRSEQKSDDDDASPPRKRRAIRDLSSDNETPPRRSSKPVGASKAREEPAVSRERPRRTDSLGRDIPESKRDKSHSPSRGRRRGDERAASSRFEKRRSRSMSPRSRRRRSLSRSRSKGRRRRSSRSRSPQRGRGRDARTSRRASRSRSFSPAKSRERGRESDRRRSRSPARSGTRASSSRQREREGSSERKRRTSPSPPAQKREREDSVRAKETRWARKTEEPASPPAKQEEKNPPKEDSKAAVASRAGLFTATEFAAEHQRKLRQNDFLHTADAKDMGANAETVYRDKRGRKLDMLNEMVRQQEILDGKRERQAREEYEWGTGKVQKQELKSQRELMDQMKSAPFARREDDPELEKLRKERVRAFDPINSKVFLEDDISGGSKKAKKNKNNKKKASGSEKPKYAGPPAPPNRFGIQPGYRWDGVVRGTGWEEKLLLRQNKQSAVSEEAYRYAVADM